MEGHLVKHAGGGLKSDKKRYFILNGNTLSYYEDKGGKKIEELDVSKVKANSGAGLQFELNGARPTMKKKEKSVYVLTALNAADKEKWLQQLRSIPGNEDHRNFAEPVAEVQNAAAEKPKPAPAAAPAAPKPKPVAKEAADTNPSTDLTPAVSHVHKFEKKTFKKPSHCSVCANMMWGMVLQGQECKLCLERVHHTCVDAAMEKKCSPQGKTAFGGAINEDDLADMMEGGGSDEDDDEEIGEMSFMKSFAGMAKLTKPAIKKIWNHYDKDGSNTLDREEIREYLRDLARVDKEEPDENNVDKVLKLMDTNGDGEIQWDEFLLFYQGSKDSNFCQQFKGVELDDTKMKEMWDHYDSDKSGSLEHDELMKFFRELFQAAGATKVGQGTQFFEAFPSFWDPEQRDFNVNPVSYTEYTETLIPIMRGASKSKTKKSSK